MALFESIKYQVVEKNGKIEIRKYNDFFLASTKTLTNQALDSGFMNVFQYISGSNDQNQKISMTTPVVTYEEGKELITGFYVPSKFSKESIPHPIDNKVFINEMKNSYYAVIRFRGSWRTENFDKYDQLLLNYIQEMKLKITSKRLIMRYQPPFIPSFLRRNEIAYQIDYSTK